MNIIERLKEKYPEMTKKQKQIAEYMMSHVDKMSFITLKELSAETQVTEMTILNACSAFGYANFNEVKYEFRKYISMQNKIELHKENEYPSSYVPNYDREEEKKLLQEICEEESAMAQKFFEKMDIEQIFRVADQILVSKKILICGRGVSKLLAEFLKLRLAGIGIGAVVVDTELNDSVHSALAMMDRETLVLAISFPDYYFMTDKLAAYAKKLGAIVCAVTNVESAEIVAYSSLTLLAPSATRLFLNTPSVPMMLVNILTSAVDLRMSCRSDYGKTEEKFAELFGESE